MTAIIEVAHARGACVPGKLRVDPEFAKLIPVPSDEERANLEASLLKDGCRDALVAWKQKDILTLLDGYTRLPICRKHMIPFKVVELSFPDRLDARIWVRTNQLARRNLTDSQRKMVGADLADDFAEKAKRERAQAGRAAGGKATPEQKANRSVTHGDTKRSGKSDRSHVKAAKALNVSAKGVRKAQDLKRKSPELADRVRTGELDLTTALRKLHEEKREAARQANAKKAKAVSDPLASGAKFTSVLLDPPWDPRDMGDVDVFGRARPDYATMRIAEIMKLPIDKLTDDDAHLYMWITNRSMKFGFDLLANWGFRFVTILTWPKPSFGLGNYFRGQTEHLLFGVRGSLMLKRKDASTLLPSWKHGPNGHSSKPPEIYEFIESCSPGPYLEMFARTKRDGWSAWGADV